MAVEQRRGYRVLLRAAAVMLVGSSLSACSSVPDWVDPTTWLGPDTSDQGQGQADNGQYPDLSKVPEAPKPASTPDERQDVTNSLATARNDVQYSAETLRGGTEAAAPPPGAAAAPDDQIATAQSGNQDDADSEPSDEGGAPDQASAPAPAPSEDNGAAAAANPDEAAAQPPAATPEEAAPPPPSSATAAEPAVAPAAEPAVPAVPASANASAVPAVPAVPDQSAAAGALPVVPVGQEPAFEPSKAPPLDASVAQFVPPPIISRYAQTGSVAAAPSENGTQVALNAPSGVRAARVGTNDQDVGGPESMSGAVVANLGTLDNAPAQPSVYTSPVGMPPVAVVLFPGDTTSIDAQARNEIRAAVAAYHARGDRGFVRVVGHSSGRTGNMSDVRHMEVTFNKSQARAKAVARELIQEGVPADKVLVDAVGDAQPVYRESMPQGEDGNRRAEIFLEG
jgi:outer membrane protein OmpA-like peptidoglycan-associated protein